MLPTVSFRRTASTPSSKARSQNCICLHTQHAEWRYTYHAPSADNEDSLNENQYLGRIDHNFGTKDLVFGRFFFNQDLSTGYGAGNMDLPHDKYFRNQNVVLDWNHTFTPRPDQYSGHGLYSRGASSWHHCLGWMEHVRQHAGDRSGGHPERVLREVYPAGLNNNGDGTFIQNRQTWQYTDFLSYVRGKHSISVGGDFRREAVNRIEDYFTDPIFNFSGTYTGRHAE